MDNESTSDNPYRAPQAELQPTRITPATQLLTLAIAARFLIASVATALILFVTHALLGGILDPQFFVAHYGTFSWERLVTYAAQDGFAYGVIFALSMLGSIWYFSRNQLNPAALWKHYFFLLAILMIAWLCGGILGVASHANGWADSIPEKFNRAKLLIEKSPISAWLIGAQSVAIACGTISMIAVPVLYTIRHRVRPHD